MATHMAADVHLPLLPTESHPPVKGPNPGAVSVACQYTQEQQLRRMQRDNGCDPSREDSYRLQGVQLIDTVRESLQLWVFPLPLLLFVPGVVDTDWLHTDPSRRLLRPAHITTNSASASEMPSTTSRMRPCRLSSWPAKSRTR